MNNEPSDDVMTSQKRKPTSMQEWAKSWSLGIEKCTKKEEKSIEINTTSVNKQIVEICDGFFKNKVSPFSACFGIVSGMTL